MKRYDLTDVSTRDYYPRHELIESRDGDWVKFADANKWTFCPECGCEEVYHHEGEHKQCERCHQEWFADVDYSAAVKANLESWHKLKSATDKTAAEAVKENHDLRQALGDLCGGLDEHWWNNEENKAVLDNARKLIWPEDA